jgi:hypothetical protein
VLLLRRSAAALGVALFAALFAAAKENGVRIGWLDLATVAEPPAPLVAAAGAGAAKVVSATAGRVLVLKPTKGAAVLRDLLREHFLGCAVVLVRGHAGRPRLEIDAEGARLELATERSLRVSIDDLLRELLRPRHRA